MLPTSLSNPWPANLPPAELTLDYSCTPPGGQRLETPSRIIGLAELSKLTVESFDTEDFLIFAGTRIPGSRWTRTYAEMMLLLPAGWKLRPGVPSPDLSFVRATEMHGKLKQVEERNGKIFDEEVVKLDRWSDDLKQGLEREIKELDRQIREARRTSALAALLKDELEARKKRSIILGRWSITGNAANFLMPKMRLTGSVTTLSNASRDNSSSDTSSIKCFAFGGD